MWLTNLTSRELDILTTSQGFEPYVVFIARNDVWFNLLYLPIECTNKGLYSNSQSISIQIFPQYHVTNYEAWERHKNSACQRYVDLRKKVLKANLSD